MSVTWNGDKLHSRIRKALLLGLNDAARIVGEKAATSISGGSKTGSVYNKKFFTIGSGEGRIVVPFGRKPSHQASAEGEAPASETGALLASSEIVIDVAQMSVTVGFTSDHAAYLEFGTSGEVGMEPRPFLRPALNSSHEEIVDAIASAVRVEIKP